MQVGLLFAVFRVAAPLNRRLGSLSFHQSRAASTYASMPLTSWHRGRLTSRRLDLQIGWLSSRTRKAAAVARQVRCLHMWAEVPVGTCTRISLKSSAPSSASTCGYPAPSRCLWVGLGCWSRDESTLPLLLRDGLHCAALFSVLQVLYGLGAPVTTPSQLTSGCPPAATHPTPAPVSVSFRSSIRPSSSSSCLLASDFSLLLTSRSSESPFSHHFLWLAVPSWPLSGPYPPPTACLLVTVLPRGDAGGHCLCSLTASHSPSERSYLPRKAFNNVTTSRSTNPPLEAKPSDRFHAIFALALALSRLPFHLPPFALRASPTRASTRIRPS